MPETTLSGSGYKNSPKFIFPELKDPSPGKSYNFVFLYEKQYLDIPPCKQKTRFVNAVNGACYALNL